MKAQSAAFRKTGKTTVWSVEEAVTSSTLKSKKQQKQRQEKKFKLQKCISAKLKIVTIQLDFTAGVQ